ncbi:MAG: hypothetical protein OEV44_00375 [Spirochaetota bacterium]|nr:hypothetical protein [Spirochaetota bacterium]
MIVKAKNKQSLMDLTVENYGQMDNLAQVSRDNNISISEYLEINKEIEINEYEGNELIKNAIRTQNITLNNDAEYEIIEIIINKVFEDGSNAIFEDDNNHILE